MGIRHHGPGSARSVRAQLEAWEPDAILVEGPPDAADALPLLTHPDTRPPVALMVYCPDEPRRSLFYPFALFSPEWQALQYGLTRSLPVRFIDLPAAHQLAVEASGDESEVEAEEDEGEVGDATQPPVQADPLLYMAQAAGYSDGERWWEHLVEQRREPGDLFAAIMEAMAALRSEVEEGTTPPHPLEPQREAHMRQMIRAAQREGLQRIAVVCGAWHAPALANMPAVKDDAALLKGLPKVKVQATWVPWTYDRLSYLSGYGAGIESPGWYHHLWTAGDQVSTRWMVQVARLLRGEDLDASAAHVIESVRLADTLAALRDRPLPGLPEMLEAAQAVFCLGDATPMRLIEEKLIVGEVLGAVPEDTPTVPLQQDLGRQQKRLRLPPEAAQKTLDLDLRKETDLGRSHLLHRLGLLGIPWGTTQRVSGKAGTFHEVWDLQWQPEFAVALIEGAKWGNTVLDAATAFVRGVADKATNLATLTGLLDRALLADLPEAIAHVMARLQAGAAAASDVPALMDALPPLANVMRYGNVRQTDVAAVSDVVDGLLTRICIGLPGTCASLDDEAAAEMLPRLLGVNGAVALLQAEAHTEAWHAVLGQMVDQVGLHGLVAGRCCRIILDARAIAADEGARRMGLALSPAGDPAQAAAWAEGFLQGSGQVLIHDEALWQVLDDWVSGLSTETFMAALPLLRRTFATFTAPERRQMGERVRRGARAGAAAADVGAEDIDVARADAVLPLVAKMLGVADE